MSCFFIGLQRAYWSQPENELYEKKQTLHVCTFNRINIPDVFIRNE